MRERLEQLVARIDARELRERVLMLATGVVILVAVADLAVFQGLRVAMANVAERKDQARESITESQQQIAKLVQKLESDPNADIRARIETLETRLERVDAQLAEQERDLINPAEMVALLRGLVEEDDALELVSMRSHPSVVVERFSLSEGDSAGVPGQVYRHGVSLVLNGSFRDAVGYLRAVEGLPWQLFWDDMDIEVTEYPRTRIRLRLHTLSLDEDWIGV
jgi:MSHA biogenesis protein MshJ